MNSAQVRAKARLAVKRREENIEAEEIEGGEINLIPYLDIVTNLMLFLLASISAGFILGQINTTLPDHVPASAVKPTDPKKKPEEQLQIVVSVTKKNIILWSISGLEGTLPEPKAAIPRLPARRGEAPKYEYWRLNSALVEIASRRWKGRLRPCDTYEIILQADGEIPYETVIDVMDTMRRKLPKQFTKEEKLTRVTMPEDEDPNDQRCKNPKQKFDPETHLLFPDILFSLGFE